MAEHEHAIPVPAGPTVLPGLIPSEEADRLSGLWEKAREQGFPRKTIEFPAMVPSLLPVMAEVGRQVWNLPVTHGVAAILGYTRGDDFPRHADITPKVLGSPGRTVSMSLLLAGEFEGGELVVGDEVVPLDVGDAVFFTAATEHQVLPVTSGNRRVAVMFGRCCEEVPLYPTHACRAKPTTSTCPECAAQFAYCWTCNRPMCHG